MRTNRNPLVQLRNFRNTMTQFRLADQHNGQQKSIVELKVRQQPEFFKSFTVFNRLCFIHNQHRADPALRIQFQALIQRLQSSGF